MLFITLAHAEGATSSAGGSIMSFVPLMMVFVVFYFLLIRPQQKRAKDHKEFVDNVKVGTKVVAVNGIVGKITAVYDTTVDLEIARDTTISVLKGALTATLPDDVAVKKPGKKKTA